VTDQQLHGHLQATQAARPRPQPGGKALDQPVLKLLRAMLRAGVMESGFVRHRCCTRWRVRSSLALA
jgi:hypothetical protein